MKKRVFLTALFVLIIIFIIAIKHDFLSMTGKSLYGAMNGVISLIVSGIPEVFIISPENTTYFFSVGEPYTLDLNVSENFEAENWWYRLEDLRHNIIVAENVSFHQNTTFNATRWSNRITVWANDSSGTTGDGSVIFYVSVPNSAPILGFIDPEILTCERSYFVYRLNATDIDEDELTFDLNPKNPFFIYKLRRIDLTSEEAELFSLSIRKIWVGTHHMIVYVNDGQYADSKSINITVIEINNAPVMENIGVQTVWTSGDNSTFYKELQVQDEESGNRTSGNLTFNLTFFSEAPLFSITSDGIMNFTPNSGDVGVHYMGLCVTDQPLSNPHPNISICGQNGSARTSCQNFSLTVTNENRRPTITSYYPTSLVLNVSGEQSLFFNISKYDPDGTIPDARWFVDNGLVQYNSGSSIDNFTYTFGCGISGKHYISAEITDGLLTDEVEWTINVADVPCQIAPREEGVAPAGEFKCVPRWVCADWTVCENTNRSLELGNLTGQDYRNILIECGLNFFTGGLCGYQIRQCFDTSNCNTTFDRPDELRSCEYVARPGCFDGVKNCHDNACEILIDCGGPCKPCPTCSDKIQNQGEEGIDCGGPCPFKCPAEIPWKAELYKWLKYLLFFVAIVLIIFILLKLVKIYGIRKEIKEYDKKEED